MNCPMCGEPWNRDRCQTCGWSERQDPVNRERVANHHPDCARVSASGQFLFPDTACTCDAVPSPETKARLLQEATELGVPVVLDAVADVVLAYRPKARSGPAVQRKRRRTILQKQKKRKR